MDLDTVSCDLCGESMERTLFYGYDKMCLWRRERFRVVQCRACGLVYVNPRPTAESKRPYYSQDYPFYQEDEKKQQPLLHYKPVIDWIDQQVGKGSILDVGTGGSLFLPTMKKRGYEVVGTEVHPQIVQHMRDTHGITMLEGPLEEQDLAGESFEAVTIMGVLEHVPSPRRLFREVNRLLKPNGTVALFCFHRGLEARILGKHWLGFDVPRHSYSFSAQILREFLEQAGFRVDHFRYPSTSFFPYSVQLGVARLRGVAANGKPLAAWQLPSPALLLLKPLGDLLSRLGESSNVYAFATKIAEGTGSGGADSR